MYQAFKKLRTSILIWLTHNMALPILQQFRNEKAFPFSMDELGNFPSGSLGKDLYCFLDNKQLELLPHYARHDIKHILLEYDTTESGEVCLQCFMLGNGHVSFPVVATVLYGFLQCPNILGFSAKHSGEANNAEPFLIGIGMNYYLQKPIGCNFF